MSDLSYQNIYKCIQTLKDNEIYRINDVVNLARYQKYHTHAVCKVILDNDKYKDTILHKFLEDITYESKSVSKYDILLKAAIFCDKKLSTKSYDNNKLLVHIRSGDNYLVSGLGNIEIFESLKNRIHQYVSDHSNITDIIIVTSLHYGHKLDSKIYSSHLYCYSTINHNKNITKIYQFVTALKNIISDKVRISLHSSKNIDFDFVTLIKAKNIITSEGGFSNLVKKINLLYHNISERKIIS